MEMVGKERQQWRGEGHFLEEGVGQKLGEKRRHKSQWLERPDTQLSWFRTIGQQDQIVFTDSFFSCISCIPQWRPPIRVYDSLLRIA